MSSPVYPCPACGATHTLHYTLCLTCRNASPAPDEVARLRAELGKQRDEHCKDCCCARSWEALGITAHTGMSIPEHITDLREQLDDRPNPPAMCRDGHETIYFGEDTEEFSDCPLCVARAQLATAEMEGYAWILRLRAQLAQAEARAASAGEVERERALRWAFTSWPYHQARKHESRGRIIPERVVETVGAYVARGLAALRAEEQP